MNVQNWSDLPHLVFSFQCECGALWESDEYEWADDQGEGWAGVALCPECNSQTTSGYWVGVRP